MIFVKNTNLLYPTRDDAITSTTHLEGYFELDVFKADAYGNKIEKSKRRVAEFHNLILNQGLDYLAQGTTSNVNSTLTCCQVGTSSVVPAAGQTGLQSFLAGTNNVVATNSTTQPSSPFYGTKTLTYEFAVGAAAGNLAEVGVGRASTGNVLFCRALILDGGGVPITITVLSDEILQVTYSLRCYPVEADTPAVVTISGSNYTFTRRPIRVTSNEWAFSLNSSTAINGFGLNDSTTSSMVAFSGGLVAATSTDMLGTSANRSSAVNNAYVSGTYTRACTGTWSIATANFGAGGIQGLQVAARFGVVVGGPGVYQYGISPGIPKINTQQLVMNYSFQWARKTI